jgi:hypothetical protein
MTIHEVWERTNWRLLAEQKRLLLASLADYDGLEGLLNWIDALQDAAEAEGYPVVFLAEQEEPQEQEGD